MTTDLPPNQDPVPTQTHVDDRGDAAAGIGAAKVTSGDIKTHPLALLIVGTVLGFVGLAAGQMVIASVNGYFAQAPLSLLAGVIAALIGFGVLWALNRLEGRPTPEFSGGGQVLELGIGLALGAGVMLLCTFIISLFDGIRFYRLNDWGFFFPLAGLAIQSGVVEEILFRGIIFRHIEQLGGTYLALAASAAFFGFVHLGNANATWLSAIGIAVEAGIMLGALYVLTRRLWAAIGMHAAWNFTQGLLGIPISGLDTASLVESAPHGPAWLSGGAFGVEASVVTMIVGTLLGLWLLRLAHQQGKIIPMTRQARASIA